MVKIHTDVGSKKRLEEYLVSLSLGSVKDLIMPFLDSISLHINLNITFLSNAWKVGKWFTNNMLTLSHLGYLNRILRASLCATLSGSSSLYYGYTIVHTYIEMAMLWTSVDILSYSASGHVIQPFFSCSPLRTRGVRGEQRPGSAPSSRVHRVPHPQHPWRCSSLSHIHTHTHTPTSFLFLAAFLCCLPRGGEVSTYPCAQRSTRNQMTIACAPGNVSE